MAALLAITIGAFVSNGAIPILFTRPGAGGGGGGETNEVGGFTTNMFIDAEDFNYTDGSVSAGGYFPSRVGTNFNATGLYAGYNATESQDFNAWDISNNDQYRDEINGIGFSGINPHNDGHQPNGVPYNDYKIRQFTADGPDWCNYTREFTNANYRVLARVSSTTTFGMQLDTISPTHYAGQVQSGTAIGGFNVTGSGTNSFFYTYFKTNGVPVEFALNSTNTIRITITNGFCDYHRLALVRWTGTPQGFANPEPNPDTIFVDENGVAFYDPEI